MATETTQSAAPRPAASHEPRPTPHETKEEVKPESAQPEVTFAAKPGDPTPLIGRAEAIIQRHTLWSLGSGLLPIPLLDIALTLGVQVKMLKELSELYGVNFSEAAVKKVLIPLLSSAGGVGIGSVVGASITKLIPGIGTTLGVVSMPVIVGAFTFATGRVFLMHFESGGTILNFDPYAMRSYFKQEFAKARETVAKIHKEE